MKHIIPFFIVECFAAVLFTAAMAWNDRVCLFAGLIVEGMMIAYLVQERSRLLRLNAKAEQELRAVGAIGLMMRETMGLIKGRIEVLQKREKELGIEPDLETRALYAVWSI